MPLLNNKKIEFSKPPKFEEAKAKGKTEFWCIRFTNELFLNYEEYLKKLHIYRQPIWESEATGKGNLTYEEALDSEKNLATKAGVLVYSPFLTRAFLLQILKPASFYSGSFDELLEAIVWANINGSNKVKCIICKQNKKTDAAVNDSKKSSKDRLSAKKQSNLSNQKSLVSSNIDDKISNDSENIDYIIRAFDTKSNKLGENKIVSSENIFRPKEINSKKAIRFLMKLCTYRDRTSNTIIVKKFIRDEFKIKVAQNIKFKEADSTDNQNLKDLLLTADKNLNDLIHSKASKKKTSQQSTLVLAPRKNLNDNLNDSKIHTANKLFPFIKINKPTTPTNKPKSENFELLKLMLSDIKKFPVDDLILLQYQYLIEHKSLLYMIDQKWDELYKCKDQEKKIKDSTSTQFKKQLKLTSSGALKLAEIPSNDIQKLDLKTEPSELTNSESAILHWPMPQYLWKVSPNLSEITLQTFLFLSWYVKPLQINGFTLDQYEVSLGHGLFFNSDFIDNENKLGLSTVIPDCSLFVGCITSLLNLIIKDRVDKGPSNDIFLSREEMFEEKYSNEFDFFNILLQEDIYEEVEVLDDAEDCDTNKSSDNHNNFSEVDDEGIIKIEDDNTNQLAKSSILRKELAEASRELKQIEEERMNLEKEFNQNQNETIMSNDKPTICNDKSVDPSETVSNFFDKSRYLKTRATDNTNDFDREKSKLNKRELSIQKQQASLEKSLQRCQISGLVPIGQDRFGTKYYYIDGIGAGLSNLTSRLWAVPTNSYFINLKKGKSFKAKGLEKSILPDFVYRSAILNMGLKIATDVIGNGEKNINSINTISFNKTSKFENKKKTTNEWLCYSNNAELDALMLWLDPRGNNEYQLLENLKEIYPKLSLAMKKRIRSFEKEKENYKKFSDALTELTNSPDSEHFLEENLNNNFFRLSNTGDFCSYSIFSMFSEPAEIYKENSDFTANGCKYNNDFKESIKTVYGDVHSPSILSEPNLQDDNSQSTNLANINTNNPCFNGKSNSKETEYSSSSDSNNSNTTDKNTSKIIGLRTRNRFRNKKLVFIESYMQYH
ncbi:hypothetical protein BB561_004488 [Smittium simulii]|uniref:WAC domain-containing protein n=1 Tax=Smittium simulii TaxID=133385 RepID=A0A2T9YG52_9FUNG|nr:hypothetical protein BB561_004488 [Smittium simulii]